MKHLIFKCLSDFIDKGRNGIDIENEIFPFCFSDIIITETTIIDTNDEEIQRYSAGSGCITGCLLKYEVHGFEFLIKTLFFLIAHF